MFNWKVSMATNKQAPRHPSPDCTRRKGWGKGGIRFGVGQVDTRQKTNKKTSRSSDL